MTKPLGLPLRDLEHALARYEKYLKFDYPPDDGEIDMIVVAATQWSDAQKGLALLNQEGIEIEVEVQVVTK
jgi:hypothetical protein